MNPETYYNNPQGRYISELDRRNQQRMSETERRLRLVTGNGYEVEVSTPYVNLITSSSATTDPYFISPTPITWTFDSTPITWSSVVSSSPIYISNTDEMITASFEWTEGPYFKAVVEPEEVKRIPSMAEQPRKWLLRALFMPFFIG